MLPKKIANFKPGDESELEGHRFDPYSDFSFSEHACVTD